MKETQCFQIELSVHFLILNAHDKSKTSPVDQYDIDHEQEMRSSVFGIVPFPEKTSQNCEEHT